MISTVNLTISSIGLAITAVSTNGTDVQEHYLHGIKGLDCIRGNFQDENAFGDNSSLVSALQALVDAAGDVAKQLRQQKENTNGTSN